MLHKFMIAIPTLIAGLFVYSFFIERYIVVVKEYNLEFRNLPENFEGYSLAIFSDLHYGSLMPEWFVLRIINKLNQLNADVILGLGDYVKKRNTTEEIKKIWPHLQTLKARDGVFLILGNHDHWASAEDSLKKLENSGMSMRHKHSCIKRGEDSICFIGAGDYWEDEPGFEKPIHNLESDSFRIVLAHSPDTADLPYHERVDLFLSGHTHGGQVVLPFTEYSPMVPVKNKKYNFGLKYNPKSTPILISKGLGWSILPLRFNCYPEIILLKLYKKK